MLKVVSFKICPFVQPVTALLEAKKVPYEIEYISLKDKPQWFLEISPHGQVPVLITESGRPLFESDAIVEYIEEVYPIEGQSQKEYAAKANRLLNTEIAGSTGRSELHNLFEDCSHLELDRHGNVLEYQPRSKGCETC